MESGIDVVTGSFSYTGQHITRRLLASGRQVRTLTGHRRPEHPLSDRVTAFPYDFERPERAVVDRQKQRRREKLESDFRRRTACRARRRTPPRASAPPRRGACSPRRCPPARNTPRKSSTGRGANTPRTCTAMTKICALDAGVGGVAETSPSRRYSGTNA